MSLFRQLISRISPLSASRALSLWAGWVLCGGTVVLTLAVSWRVLSMGDVGNGAVAALLALAGPLSAMVSINYRAKASGDAAPKSAGVVGGAAPANIEGDKR